MGKKLQSSNDSQSAIICFILGQDYASCVTLLYEAYVAALEPSNPAQNEYSLQEIFEEITIIKYILGFVDNRFHQETEHVLV